MPVAVAFGRGPLHQCRARGKFDLARAVAENKSRLLRSYQKRQVEDDSSVWEDIIFQYGPHSFLYADKELIDAYASSVDEAEALVQQFRKDYCTLNLKTGVFHLIKQTRTDIDTEEIELPEESLLTDEQMELHYPQGMLDWHEGLLQKLEKRRYGLSIFEGEPGTGKTSYLRHLATLLRNTHRFYFIPPSNMDILSRPSFVGFWSNQRRWYSEKHFVVILEDSDTALMTRGADNREQVSAILNLSDGLLGDFLRLQIICTINGSAEEIDPALMRPGRLTSHHLFRRLPYEQATTLAATLDKSLTAERPYTLAEIFSGDPGDEREHRRIGFVV